MTYQAVFKRYELKYILTPEQKKRILEAMEGRMTLDRYGRSTIRNIYFDTDSYRLVRRSMEKPVYKEKLRIRSYSQVHADDIVFVELKKKYDSVVYKRRLSLTEAEAMDWVTGHSHLLTGQIAGEIDYFLGHYETLHPVVFLSYEREAYYSLDGSDFRVTFDENILCRRSDLCLESDVGGTPLLGKGLTLMEIKCAGGIPLWMTHALTAQHIFKTSFSKYGTAYQTIIYPNCKGERFYA